MSSITEIDTKVRCKMENHTDMAFTSGLMAEDIKENTEMASKLAMVDVCIKTTADTKESGRMTRDTDMAHTSMLMEASPPENGKMAT